MSERERSVRAWVLEDYCALLRENSLAGRIDVVHPDLGLQNVQVNECSLHGQLLNVQRGSDGPNSWPLAVAETYVRGDDLIATYRPVEDWPYSPQIYWRTGALDRAEGLFGSLSLLVSVQTHLLDTHPKIDVLSRLATTEILQIAADPDTSIPARSITEDCEIPSSMGVCGLVRRLKDVPISYAEFMPASDFQLVRVERDAQGFCSIRWTLFADFLEKGVIRKARLQGAFLPRENDLQLAAACCSLLKHDSLPLTT